MLTDINNKNIVITGGGSGIGKAIAESFAREGANIFITYHTEEKRKEIEDFIENRLPLKKDRKATAFLMDVRKEEDQINCLEQAKHFFNNEIDVFVNNAGIINRSSFLELTNQETYRVFEINFLGPLFLLQKFSKHMVEKQKEYFSLHHTFRDYSLINITSISSKIPRGLSLYESSKAALKMLSRSLAYELSAYHIRVNSVAPGPVQTELNRESWEKNSSFWKKNNIAPVLLNRAGDAEEVAFEVVTIAKNAWKTGTSTDIDGGRSINWTGSEIQEKNELKFKAKL